MHQPSGHQGDSLYLARDRSLGAFSQRVFVVCLIAALAVAAWQLTNVLLLLFAAALLATGVSAITDTLVRSTGMRRPLALAGVIVISLAVFIAAFWIFGAMVAEQLDKVTKAAPAGYALFIDWLGKTAFGRQLVEQAKGFNLLGATSWATSFASSAVSYVTSGVAYVVITLFMAVYLAAQPDRYLALCLRLVPPSSRPVAARLAGNVSGILTRWLLSKVIVIAVIGAMTGAGLWLLGIEAAFTLGVLGGLLCFIPFFGAVLAAVPATLVALTQGPLYALSVVVMYVGVQFIEGNFITPMIEDKAASLPPVVALLATVALAILFGPAGVLLAAPLTLLMLETLEVLYVQEALGETPVMSPVPD